LKKLNEVERVSRYLFNKGKFKMTRTNTQATTVESIIQQEELSATTRLVLIFLSDLPPYDRKQDSRSIERRTGLSHTTVSAALKSLVQGKKVDHSLAYEPDSTRSRTEYSSLFTLGIPLGKKRPQPVVNGGLFDTGYEELI
jgi:hypothetical protein